MKPDPNQELRSVPAVEARELLEQQRHSGLKIAAFARLKGVQPWSLYNAQAIERRRTKRESPAQLEEVRVVESPGTAGLAGAVELSLPSGIAIRVDRDFDEVALRRVLGVLSSC